MSYSEQARYKKIYNLLLQLKYFIENDPDKEYEYIKEFFTKYNIYEDIYYTLDKLNNFINFVKKGNYVLDTTKRFEQIIKYACDNRKQVERVLSESVVKKRRDKVFKNKIEHDIYKTNITQNRIINVVDRIKAENKDVMFLIENLENELNDVNFNRNERIRRLKRTHNFGIDTNQNNISKKEKLDAVKKKNKLLEYMMLQRKKKNNLFNV
jgi:hypothetical protein